MFMNEILITLKEGKCISKKYFLYSAVVLHNEPLLFEVAFEMNLPLSIMHQELMSKIPTATACALSLSLSEFWLTLNVT